MLELCALSVIQINNLTKYYGKPLTGRIKEMLGTPEKRLAFLISRILQDRRENPEFYQFFYRVLVDEKHAKIIL
jgi:hypothetical protein